MSLHPIQALDHVIDEYADYLRAEIAKSGSGFKY